MIYKRLVLNVKYIIKKSLRIFENLSDSTQSKLNVPDTLRRTRPIGKLKVMQQQQESEKQLTESITDTLKSIQFFFHTNKVGQQDGEELLNGFIAFAFQGNALCGTDKEDTTVLDLNSPEVQEWSLEIRPLVVELAASNCKIIENLYAPNADRHKYVEILRDAFLDTILGYDDQVDGLTDVTSGLVTCMVACHGRIISNTFPEIKMH